MMPFSWKGSSFFLSLSGRKDSLASTSSKWEALSEGVSWRALAMLHQRGTKEKDDLLPTWQNKEESLMEQYCSLHLETINIYTTFLECWEFSLESIKLCRCWRKESLTSVSIKHSNYSRTKRAACTSSFTPWNYYFSTYPVHERKLFAIQIQLTHGHWNITLRKHFSEELQENEAMREEQWI